MSSQFRVVCLHDLEIHPVTGNEILVKLYRISLEHIFNMSVKEKLNLC